MSAAAAVTTELQAVLDEHAPHLTLTEDGRVRCELNGHTLPAQADAVAAFVNGKKYKKLKAKADLEGGLERYEPFLVPSRNFPRMLYCALTDDLINANHKEIQQHLKGRKFRLAKERFQNDKQGLHTEIDLLTSDVEEGEDEQDEGGEGSDSEGPGLWLPEEALQEHEMIDAEGAEDAPEDEAEGAAAADRGEEAADEQPGSSMEEDGQQQRPAAAAGRGGRGSKTAAGGKRSAAAAAKGKGKQQQNGGDAGDAVGKVKPPKAKRSKK